MINGQRALGEIIAYREINTRNYFTYNSLIVFFYGLFDISFSVTVKILFETIKSDTV